MRKKLFVFLLIILFFGVTLTGYMSYRFAKNLILRNVNESLVSEARLIEGYIALLNENPNYDLLAKELKGRIGKRITIIRQDGKVIGESDKPSEELENHLYRPEIRDAIEKGDGTAIRYSSTEGTYMYYYASKYVKNTRIYVLRLSMPLKDIKLAQANILRLIIFAIITGIIICSILAFLYVNIFTQPIRQLTKVATNIALGQYDKRINISTKDEIGQLGHAFNLMAGRLEDTIKDLRDKKNKLESILTSMDDGVIVVDNHEKVILINPAARNMFSIEGEAVGKHIIEVIRNNEMENMIKNVPENEMEIRISYPNPRFFRLKTVKVVNYEKDRKGIGLCLVIQDITKIKALEKMRSDFVANVSHELRTPLTSIKGFAETLKYVEDQETRNKFLDIIYVESERLTRLINDILTLSELENRDYAANFEKINVNRALEEIYSIMEPVARNKNITLKYAKYDNELFISGDRDKFKQMIINLVDNAVKYTGQGGTVEINLSFENEKARISIKDNGIGIPGEHIPRLFERFYRVDKARSRSLGGTGLGLAIVKHILLMFKGEIKVKSKVGEGTTFTIYLPCTKIENANY